MKSEVKIPSIITTMKKAQNRAKWRNLVNRKCAM